MKIWRMKIEDEDLKDEDRDEWMSEVRSSTGRAPVSKTGGWGFESLRACLKVGRGVALIV